MDREQREQDQREPDEREHLTNWSVVCRIVLGQICLISAFFISAIVTANIHLNMPNNKKWEITRTLPFWVAYTSVFLYIIFSYYLICYYCFSDTANARFLRQVERDRQDPNRILNRRNDPLELEIFERERQIYGPVVWETSV